MFLNFNITDRTTRPACYTTLKPPFQLEADFVDPSPFGTHQ